MTLRVGNYVSITSTNNCSSNYGFVTIINDDNMIEVKLTIGTTIKNIKKMTLMLSLYILSIQPFVRNQPEYFFHQSNQYQL